MPFLLIFAFLVQSIAPAANFPSDSRPLSQSQDGEIIQTVCPGYAEKTEGSSAEKTARRQADWTWANISSIGPSFASRAGIFFQLQATTR